MLTLYLFTFYKRAALVVLFGESARGPGGTSVACVPILFFLFLEPGM